MENTTEQLTADTITDAQIEALKDEAGAAGDAKLADYCRIALNMTPLAAWTITPYGARIECAAAIADARAQAE